jgi:DNA-binding transcriptional MerR regulator
MTVHTVEAMCQAGCTSRRGIRFWEEKGLLGPVERSGGNQRKFTDEQLTRAKIIAAAQFGGFTLDEIEKMLPVYDMEVFEAITHKLARVVHTAMTLTEQLPAPAGEVQPVQEFDL